MGEGIENVTGGPAEAAAPKIGFLKKAAMYTVIAYVALNFTSCWNRPMQQDISSYIDKEQKIQAVSNADYHLSNR